MKDAVRGYHEGCSWKSLGLRGEVGGLMTGVVGGFLEEVQLVFPVVQYTIIGIVQSMFISSSRPVNSSTNTLKFSATELQFLHESALSTTWDCKKRLSLCSAIPVARNVLSSNLPLTKHAELYCYGYTTVPSPRISQHSSEN